MLYCCNKVKKGVLKEVKITLKYNLLISIFLIISLYGSSSYAVQNINETPKRHKRENFRVDTTAKKELATTNNNKQVLDDKNNTTSPILAQQEKQPLIAVQSAEFVNETSSKQQKKNAVLEFSSEFNDKLQQILIKL